MALPRRRPPAGPKKALSFSTVEFAQEEAAQHRGRSWTYPVANFFAHRFPEDSVAVIMNAVHFVPQEPVKNCTKGQFVGVAFPQSQEQIVDVLFLNPQEETVEGVHGTPQQPFEGPH